jgi:hypothetical protein
MKFIGLTDFAGNRIWVGAEWIAVVRQPLPSEYHGMGDATINAVLVMSGHQQAVQETVEQVKQALVAVAGLE